MIVFYFSVIYIFQSYLLFVNLRKRHASGISDLARDKSTSSKINGWVILQKMFSYVWPKNRPSIRARVVVAVSLLIGAKVCLL